MNTQHLVEALVFALVALGVQATAADFLAGSVFSISGAALAFAFAPETGRADYALTLFGALFLSTLTAIAHPHVGLAGPVQLWMGLAGFFARHLLRFSIRFARRMVLNADDLADGILARLIGRKK